MTARAEITDFWAMVFNPSSVDRLVHTLIGAFILGAFFVMSVTAWYILHGRHLRLAKQSFTIALVFGTLASLAALVTGHEQANTVSRTQPAKLAAFEGHFKTGPADLWLFGIPDEQREMVKYGLAIPGGLSFLLHGDFNAPVTGLDQFAPEDRPPLHIPFQAYHLMVALGMYFIGLTLFASYLRWRGTLFDRRWLLWVFVVSVIGPYLANHAGWVAAEVGRQPWIVYGLLRTSDALSKSVKAEEVLASIILFSIIYLFLLAVWLYVMHEKIKHGPEEVAVAAETGGKGGLLDAMSTLADHGGPSMTEARGGKEKK
jgi:cytochrome bd ubiquinol oxidase subunit I